MALLTGTTSYDDLANADLVIEAVFENMDVKKEVFSTLKQNRSTRRTLLATNTSYLDIDEIATVVDNPERMLGMHFFSPPTLCGCWKSCVPRKLRLRRFSQRS